MSFSVVSTFSGCGGSSFGYQLAGGKVRLAVEWDDNAVATYRLNFPETPIYHGDIADLSVDEALRLSGLQAGELDIFDGSPPCQGFSTAGKRKFDDDRNQLFREYVRLLRGFRPKVLVMENVSGMVKGKMRLIFVECLRELKASGYRVKARVLNAMYFNVPQSRQRCIFIGARDDLGIEPNHPKARTKSLGLRRALGLRRGWGKVNEGIKNKQFKNDWRNLDLPCVTLEKTRPPILLEDGIERELTVEECSRLASYPDTWLWGPRAYQRIGNSVPPNFMRAIAEHIRDTILGGAATGRLE